MAERARRISADQLHERLPVENPHDELGQLATVVNDMFARLEQSFESMRRFTADASHELRTPLTALRSVGEVGLADARTSREYQDIIGSMLEEASKLGRLVEGLLLLSRSEAGHQQLRREPVDLSQKVRDIAGQLAVLAEEKGQTIDVAAVSPIEVAVDRGVCRHALVNVLDNAIKYGPSGSTIRVTVRRDAGMAVVEVQDEGPGVSAEDREKVFQRFYRAGHAGHSRVAGSGLGLSIARWAAELHGGRLEYVAGQAPGACFRLTIPLA
jgi:heavy metal sensor kinase